MKLICLSITVILSIMPASAFCGGIFDIFNETTYNGSLSIVTEYPEPNKTIHEHKHIRGWVDIVGFEDVIRINGTEYYNHSEPIIKYDIWDEGLFWNDNFDSIEVTNTRIIHDYPNITVELDVHLRWHHSTLKSRTVNGKTRKWIDKEYHNEYTTMTAYAKAPKHVYWSNNTRCTITIYNNSFNPHVHVHVPIEQFQTKTVYQYGNENITRRTLIGTAEVGAVNMSECLQWDDDSELFGYRNDTAVLNGLNASTFDPSKLNITVHNPYEHKQITEYNISVVEFSPDKMFNDPAVPMVLVLMMILGYGCKRCFDVVGGMI